MIAGRVYVAGPVTVGDQFVNMRKAFDAAEKLLNAGFMPFVPHATCIWQAFYEHDYETWMKYDDAWLAMCEFLVRIPGESKGADREVARAHELGIPVHHDLDNFIRMYGRIES